MTHGQTPGIAATPMPPHPLDEQQNARAVDLIESAERSAPYCLCGAHMLAIARGDQIWLECASRQQQRDGLDGLVARLTAFSHTRRMIMELPARS